MKSCSCFDCSDSVVYACTVTNPSTVLEGPKPESFGPKTFTIEKHNLPWKVIKDENRLALPVDYVCPNCNRPINFDVTGNLRCYFCGETAHPLVFAYVSRKLIHDSEEKRRGLLPFVPEVPNPITEAKKKRDEMNMRKFIRKIKY